MRPFSSGTSPCRMLMRTWTKRRSRASRVDFSSAIPQLLPWLPLVPCRLRARGAAQEAAPRAAPGAAPASRPSAPLLLFRRGSRHGLATIRCGGRTRRNKLLLHGEHAKKALGGHSPYAPWCLNSSDVARATVPQGMWTRRPDFDVALLPAAEPPASRAPPPWLRRWRCPLQLWPIRQSSIPAADRSRPKFTTTSAMGGDAMQRSDPAHQ